jgi:hypothetical protein
MHTGICILNTKHACLAAAAANSYPRAAVIAWPDSAEFRHYLSLLPHSPRPYRPFFRRKFPNVLQTASPRLYCPSRCIVRRCWNTIHSSSGRGWVDSRGKLLLPSQLISPIALYSGAPRNILGQWFYRSLRAWTKIPPGVTGPILQERQSEVIACYGIGTEVCVTRGSSCR